MAQRRLTLFNINRLQGKELVATPFVDDDEGIKSLTRPGGDVPDERGLGQVHEEVEVTQRDILNELKIELPDMASS